MEVGVMTKVRDFHAAGLDLSYINLNTIIGDNVDITV
jgi:hypothetical protein